MDEVIEILCGIRINQAWLPILHENVLQGLNAYYSLEGALCILWKPMYSPSGTKSSLSSIVE
jgi:hypothetical protein